MNRGPMAGSRNEPPTTPLLLEIPLRGGAFTAKATVPLDATDQELWAICSAVITPIRERKNPPNPAIWVADAASVKMTGGEPAENLSPKTLDRIERGKAKHFPTAKTCVTDDVWRCVYCHAQVEEDAECENPPCVQKRQEAEGRMGISRITR